MYEVELPQVLVSMRRKNMPYITLIHTLFGFILLQYINIPMLTFTRICIFNALYAKVLYDINPSKKVLTLLCKVKYIRKYLANQCKTSGTKTIFNSGKFSTIHAIWS